MCVPSLNNRVAHPVAPLNAVKGGVSLFDFLRNDVASIGALNGNAQQQQQQPPPPPQRPAGVANDVEMMMVDSTPGDFRHEEVTVGETNLLRSGSGAASSSSTASPSVSSVDAVASKPQTAGGATKKIEHSARVAGDKPRPKRRRKRNQLKPGKTAKQQDRHFVVHNYHDHAGDPEQPGLSTTCEFNNRGGVATPFPSKLHAALSAIEEEGRSDVASWQPHGRCFIVHKPKEFQADLLPKYFNLTKITSFQRQLNLYGFTRLSRGQDHGGYYHELFLRGRPSLCLRIVRTKTKGTKFKAASSPESEPDFYSMAPVGPPPAAPPAVDGDEEKMEASPTVSVEKSETTVPSASPCPRSRVSKVFAEQPFPEPIPFVEARRLSFPPPPAEVLSVFKADPTPSSPALSPITPRRKLQKVQEGPPSDEDVDIPPLEVSLSMMMFEGPQEEEDDAQAPPRPHSPVRKSVSVGREDYPIRRRQEMDPYEPLPVEPNKAMTTTGAAPMVAGSWAGLFASSDARALELGAAVASASSAAAANQVSESSSSEATPSSSSSLSSSSSSELDDEKEICGDILGEDNGGVDPIDDFVRSMISIDDDLALGDYLDVLVDC